MARNFNVNKGKCKANSDSLVDVILRDGEVLKRQHCEDDLDWSITNDEKDIIFWRLSKQKKEKNV